MTDTTTDTFDLDVLERFIAKQAGDDVKTDLELTCTVCETHVCDIEANDNLRVLAASAAHHAVTCAGRASKVTVTISNWYSDGHESEHKVVLTAPANDEDALTDWWHDVVFDHTGDGHGLGRPGLGSVYTATITDAAHDPSLVGRSYEWID